MQWLFVTRVLLFEPLASQPVHRNCDPPLVNSSRATGLWAPSKPASPIWQATSSRPSVPQTTSGTGPMLAAEIHRAVADRVDLVAVAGAPAAVDLHDRRVA